MSRDFTIILIAVVVVILGPLMTIWSLNTLFPVLDIPYTLDTWAATILLGLFIRAKVEK